MKKSLIFSLLGHLTFFSIFGFSFGNKIPQANYAPVSFWGDILKNYDFRQEVHSRGLTIEKLFPHGLKDLGSQVKNQVNDPGFGVESCLKPQALLASNEEKPIYKAPPAEKPVLSRKESVIMLHPELPYYFNLYFKDRQVVHIELAFNIIPRGKSNSILVRRKISSGNLEVDLLTMRYLSHYLFLQQSVLAPNIWQTVKIEFSPK
ncbi:MAG: hypothetical protein PHY94_04470 [Candidatus Omnitrophica bacterium]|nr:hypothetical protein [Candidatus Omnitrophota bacterium]